MAHADLTQANAANVARACRAGEALLGVLGTDPHVQQAYRAWLRANDLTPAWLEHLRARRAAAIPVPQDVRDVQDFQAALHQHQARDTAWLAGWLRETLAVRYAWLAPLLLAQFRTWAYSTASGVSVAIAIQPSPAKIARLPRGRAARHDGVDIERDVRWFYRAKIQTPRETTWALGKEHAAAQHRRTEAHSVVEGGIRRAAALLHTLTAPRQSRQAHRRK